MPLDFWIAQTDSFDSLLSPSPAGTMPSGEVASVLSELHTRGQDTWVCNVDGEPLLEVETVAVGDRDVIRLGTSLAWPQFETRLEQSHEIACSVASKLSANLFEAAGGRQLQDLPERFVRKRVREADRLRDTLAQGSLAPLEFPLENLDAVANVLTLAMSGEATKTYVADGSSARWRWEDTPFDAALGEAKTLLKTGSVRQFDGREVDDALVRAVCGRDDEFFVSFYAWWRVAREQFRNA